MITPRTRRPLRILLADDGSPNAAAVAAMLGDLPLPGDSLIEVLAVLTEREGSYYGVRQAALEQLVARLQARGHTVNAELRLGYPVDVIAETADLMQPDLLAMGAKGRRASLDILLGGVAQHLLEYGRWPMLIVRMPYTGLWHTLLVSDGSPGSRFTEQYLADFPLPDTTDVRALHVLPPDISPALYTQSLHVGPEVVVHIDPREMERQLERDQAEEQHGRALLAETVEHLQSSGLTAQGMLRRGDAATEILTVIKEQRIDLVVAGARGRRTDIMVGAVARKLVHYAPCSVLVVK